MNILESINNERDRIIDNRNFHNYYIEKYRMRFVAKGKSNNRTRALLKRLLLDFSSKSYKNINISIDVNPNSL